jgi:hypothetical protein
MNCAERAPAGSIGAALFAVVMASRPRVYLPLPELSDTKW